MAKVSVGLRGWRFEEDDIFTADGEWRPLDEMPDDTRERLLRLVDLVEEPCDACYLVHGEAEVRRCNQAAIVYGEPGDEVLLCDDHEADFLYWFREAGGREHAGEEAFRDRFHEWFHSGGRAPEGYGPDEHVETEPEALPDLPSPTEVQRRLEASPGFEKVRYDMRRAADWYDEDDEAAGEAGDEESVDRDDVTGGDDSGGDGAEDGEEADVVDLDDVDLDVDYPTK